MKLPLIASALGIILLAFGGLILLPALFAVLDKEYFEVLPFVVASICCLALGFFCRWYGRSNGEF